MNGKKKCSFLFTKSIWIKKVSGADLNWYDFPGNDEFPALAEHLGQAAKCTVTPKKTCHQPANHQTNTSSTCLNDSNVGVNDFCSASQGRPACTNRNSKNINTNTISHSNNMNKCLHYTWRLINESSTLKRRLMMSQRSAEGERISPVLIEIDKLTTTNVVEAQPQHCSTSSCEEHLAPIVCEPGERANDDYDNDHDDQHFIKGTLLFSLLSLTFFSF